MTFSTSEYRDLFLRKSSFIRRHRNSSSTCTFVVVYDTPFELSDEALAHRLSRYGSVLGFRRCNLQGYEGIKNGTRVARMELSESIPSFLRFGRKLLRVKHEGQVPTCRKCHLPDHVAKVCPNVICFNCDQLGHTFSDCKEEIKCSICKEDGHYAIDCKLSWWRRPEKVDTGDNDAAPAPLPESRPSQSLPQPPPDEPSSDGPPPSIPSKQSLPDIPSSQPPTQSSPDVLPPTPSCVPLSSQSSLSPSSGQPSSLSQNTPKQPSTQPSQSSQSTQLSQSSQTTQSSQSTIANKLRNLLPDILFDTAKLSNFVRSRKDESAIFSIPSITERDVVSYLLKIDSNKSTGIDDISSRMLKLAAPFIAPSIARLINLSFSLNVFPCRWKTAKVTPIFKSGDPADVTNYRPISVLPILSKIAERHVYNALYSFLSENDLIYTRQSGFRLRHSTETALIKVIDDLLFNLDNDCVSGMVLIDYRKAFDMIDHTLLLKKREVYGLSTETLQWFTSYLTNRRQLVKLGDKQSNLANVPHGISQGSILGPLLFIVFINDLPFHVTSSTIDLYADDTTLTSCANYSSIDKLEQNLNSSVAEIAEWAASNKLPINESKTKAILITGKRLASKINYEMALTINGTKLEVVPSVKLLSLEIDFELSFNSHVEKLCTKLSKRIGILKKIRSCLPMRQRLLFYNSMIRSVLHYVSSIWTSCDKANLGRVLKLQKRAARVISDADNQASSVKLFNRLQWLPFYEESKIAKCCVAYKRIKGEVPLYTKGSLILNSQQHNRATRYSNINFICPRFNRMTEGGRSFAVTTCQLWNS